MKTLNFAFLLPLIASLGACSNSPLLSLPAAPVARNVDVDLTPGATRETVLLVSLEDGSVIKQTIYSSADVCFKNNSDSRTTCLTQGAPVYDPATDTVIGFEMIEEQIDLVAKSD